ncbi:hypothetical protein SESBI_04672 [Sesbania bispinosa]|nr:hypothetical protein SESBI_04672 [Sesbania bispinosa]
MPASPSSSLLRYSAAPVLFCFYFTSSCSVSVFALLFSSLLRLLAALLLRF